MGGDSYDRDVGHSSSSGGFDYGGTSSDDAKAVMDQRGIDSLMVPYNRYITATGKHQLLFGLDVTGSNREFSRIVYDKLPMFYGQIIEQGYLPEVEIGLAAIGDAYTDEAPLQVAEFASAKALDDWITRLYLEGHGGGQFKETYELWAYYYARRATFKSNLSFGFLVVDEAPYPQLTRRIVDRVVGGAFAGDIDTGQIFAELNGKLNGNLYVIQNPYCGTGRGRVEETQEINQSWQNILGKTGGTIIPLKEEKSLIDVILGVIAMKSGSRTLTEYQDDMSRREQSDDRIGNVTESINKASKVILPADTPDAVKRNSGARRN